MADLQHDTLAHAQAHEPKHITLNGTSASGKVITNSGSTPSTSEYRSLKEDEITEVQDYYSVWENDATRTTALIVPAMYPGTIVGWLVVQEDTLTTAENIYELRIDGVQVTSTPITVLLAGSIGDQYSASATAANTFATGAGIEVFPTTVGNTDASASIRFIIQVTRS